ncbi:MAG TPA: 3-deoxy-D-manno-octulosonic acid transferase, partial [Geobacterales bacterium]|nr:3-deoxy-D-manno-octulosonic acid transferase [Geobacterales bacterium]
RPLIAALRSRFPDHQLLVSTTTETGQGVAQGVAGVDISLYFPFDYRFAVRRALSLVNPAVVIIVETELWPNFLAEARRQGVPVVLANGRISDRSFPRYLRFRWFFRSVLANFSALCAQSDEDAQRLIAMGAPAERVMVARNLKYDLPVSLTTADERRSMRQRHGLPLDTPLLVAASTHAGEEELVAELYGQLQGEFPLSLVLVPRHPERATAVAEMLRQHSLQVTLLSQQHEGSGALPIGQILLVDRVGLLMEFYAAADLAFVGGSLVPVGGHNLLEPASLGLPVLFGPHMSNFREISALILGANAGVQVADLQELLAACRRLLRDPHSAQEMGRRGAAILSANSGATQKHLAVIEQAMSLAHPPA